MTADEPAIMSADDWWLAMTADALPANAPLLAVPVAPEEDEADIEPPTLLEMGRIVFFIVLNAMLVLFLQILFITSGWFSQCLGSQSGSQTINPLNHAQAQTWK